MKTDTWPKDEQIDAILFRAQLEGVDFQNRVLKFERTNPLIYVGECTDAIFSLLKKEYDTPRKRALSATARLKAMLLSHKYMRAAWLFVQLVASTS